MKTSAEAYKETTFNKCLVQVTGFHILLQNVTSQYNKFVYKITKITFTFHKNGSQEKKSLHRPLKI